MGAPGNIATTPSTTGVSTGLADILAMLNVVAPSGSYTQTTSTNVDPLAVQAAVNNMLGGTQGLAAVAGGQKSAGLYNSSMNTLLVNDLLSKTAAQAASLNKTETTTKKAAAQVNPMTALLGALGVQAMGGMGGLGKLLGSATGSKKGTVDESGAKSQGTKTMSDEEVAAAMKDLSKESNGAGSEMGGSDFGAASSASDSSGFVGGVSNNGGMSFGDYSYQPLDLASSIGYVSGDFTDVGGDQFSSVGGSSYDFGAIDYSAAGGSFGGASDYDFSSSYGGWE